MKVFFKLTVLALTLAALAPSGFGYDFPKEKAPKFSKNVAILEKISAGITEVAERSRGAIVFVSVSKTLQNAPFGQIDPFEFFFGPQFRQRRPERKAKGLGSGFLVDLDKGYVITNNHVIDGADEISLKLANGEVYNAKVLGADKNTDVAVVQIIDEDFNRKGVTHLSFSDSDKVKVGEFVLAIGAPFGLESSLSFGVLSAHGRGNLEITDLGNFMQTDAAINPGNSGGPLLNIKGQVIGMNTAIYSKSGSSAGIGFAVPANLVRNHALQLISKGKVSRGFLGIHMYPLDQDLADDLGLPKGTKGVLVSYVQPGTPAEKAGLKDHDVIVKVNGKDVGTRGELSNAIGLLKPGTATELTYYRKGKLKKTSAYLSEYPGQPSAAKSQRKIDSHNKINGMTLRTFNLEDGSRSKDEQERDQEAAEIYKLTSKTGLLVTSVDANSRAAAAGLQEGDLLLKAYGVKLLNPKDLKKAMRKKRKILLHIERSGEFLFATITKPQS